MIHCVVGKPQLWEIKKDNTVPRLLVFYLVSFINVWHNTECKLFLLAQSNFNRFIDIQTGSITSQYLADYLYVCILPQRNYISR